MSHKTTQQCYHAAPMDPEAELLLDAAMARLMSLGDARTRAIFAPLADSDTQEIRALAEELRSHSTHMVVIGSGGSGLSSRALAATHTEVQRSHTMHVLDSCDLYAAEHLMRELAPQETTLLIISKSGSTVETIAYADIWMRWMAGAHDASKRIVMITMHDGNVLHRMALDKGFACLPHDGDLCGRFSILSHVGLLPAAFLNMDIGALLSGAKAAFDAPARVREAVAWQYAATTSGHVVHVCFAYGNRFAPLAAWWRQCIAESLGKQGRGVYPIVAVGTRDQHSQLQLYLEGCDVAIFSLITEASAGRGMGISEQVLLPYLAQKTLGDIIASQQHATLETLIAAGKPLRHFALESHDVFSIGAVICQWMMEVIALGYMFDVNPFDQPAVEESKRLARAFFDNKS